MADALQALVGIFGDAVNRILRLDPDGLSELGEFSGHVIRLDLRAWRKSFYLFPSEAGVDVRTEYAGLPDTTLSASLAGLLDLAGGRQSRAFSAGEITISGDVELGQRFQAALWRLRPDWEEAAARLFGDPLAHRLGNLLRAAGSGVRASGAVILRDLAEYLQCERGDLPPRHEVDTFLDAVDVLRLDVDRLEQRLARLAPLAGSSRG